MRRLSTLLALLAIAFCSAASAACNTTGSVPNGAVIYHGAPVGMFTWQNPGLNPAPPFSHPSNPDGPAWFAGNWQFSVHAGIRYLLGQSDVTMYLYQYQLKQTIATLTCETHADFSKQTGISFANGDFDAAVDFCKNKAPFQYNGYVILKDQVREEPELILCDPSSVLTYNGQKAWPVSQVTVKGTQFTGGVGQDFSGQEYACILNNSNLSDFTCGKTKSAQDRLQEEAKRVLGD